MLVHVYANGIAQSARKIASQAETQIAERKYYENIILLENGLTRFPGDPRLLKLQMVNYSLMNKQTKADSIFIKNSSLFRNEDFINFYIDRLFALGKFRNVIEEFEKKEFKNEFDIQSWNYYLNSYFNLQEIDSLEKIVATYISKEPKNYLGYYYRALCYEKKKLYEQATNSLNKAQYYLSNTPELKIRGTFTIQASLARNIFAIGQNTAALEACEKALAIQPEHAGMNLLKARILIREKNYSSAQEALMNALAAEPESTEILLVLFSNSITLQNKATALTSIRKISEKRTLSDSLLFQRGTVYLQNKLYLDAFKDFRYLQKKGATFSQLDDFTRASRIDTEAPKIKILAPLSDTLQYGIKNKNELFNIKFTDKSGIVKIIFNDSIIPLNVDTSFEFQKEVLLNRHNKLDITATDIFENNTTINIPIRKDFVRPTMEILYPIVLNNNTLVPENPDDNFIYIELSARDNNMIQILSINNVDKKITPKKEVKFLNKINIAKADSIIIRCQDEMGNELIRSYYIDREKARQNLKNPMGKTYVLLITNSKYQHIKELNGPSSDATLIKSCLSGYMVDSLIHYENTTLSDFRRIFNTEVPEWINKQHVKSLLVWYGGHGTFSEFYNSGYWIPVEGPADDVNAYYPLSEMKLMLASCKKLMHLLVISDACQTGQSFYSKNIAKNVSNPCEEWSITKMRSAECFTSSDNQLSSDNSIFATAFSRVLQNHTSGCVGIVEVASRVTEIVQQNQTQTPIFGTITGMESENGSFVFIKRSFVEGSK